MVYVNFIYKFRSYIFDIFERLMMVFMIWEFFYFEVKVGVLLVFRIIWNDYWEFFL